MLNKWFHFKRNVFFHLNSSHERVNYMSCHDNIVFDCSLLGEICTRCTAHAHSLPWDGKTPLRSLSVMEHRLPLFRAVCLSQGSRLWIGDVSWFWGDKEKKRIALCLITPEASRIYLGTPAQWRNKSAPDRILYKRHQTFAYWKVLDSV